MSTRNFLIAALISVGIASVVGVQAAARERCDRLYGVSRSMEFLSLQSEVLKSVNQWAREKSSGNEDVYRSIMQQSVRELQLATSESRAVGREVRAEDVLTATRKSTELGVHDELRIASLTPEQKKALDKKIQDLMDGLLLIWDGQADVHDPAIGKSVKFPFVAAIKNGANLCSAVRVAPGAALTAAHCVCELGLNDVNAKPSMILGISLQLGAAVPIDTAKTVMIAPTFCQHYDKASRSYDASMNGLDLAVVFFDESQVSSFQKGVHSVIASPAYYQSFMQPKPRETVFASGYGDDPPNARVGVRLCGELKVEDAICSTGGVDGVACARDREFVLDERLRGSSTGTCAGDSGGGVFLLDGDGTLVLAGITARGGQCTVHAPGGYGIYSMVSNAGVISWLEGLAGKLKKR